VWTCYKEVDVGGFKHASSIPTRHDTNLRSRHDGRSEEHTIWKNNSPGILA